MPKYSNLEIAERVQAYIARAEKDNNVKIFPFDEVAAFQIIGGVNGDGPGRKEVKPMYRGKFMDVLAYAVQQPDFLSSWGADTSNPNSGYIVKWVQPEITLPPERPKGLDKLVKEVASKQDAKKKRK